MRLFGFLNAVWLYQYECNKIFVEHRQLPSIIRMSPGCAMPMSSCCVKLKASVTSMSLVPYYVNVPCHVNVVRRLTNHGLIGKSVAN